MASNTGLDSLIVQLWANKPSAPKQVQDLIAELPSVARPTSANAAGSMTLDSAIVQMMAKSASAPKQMRDLIAQLPLAAYQSSFKATSGTAADSLIVSLLINTTSADRSIRDAVVLLPTAIRGVYDAAMDENNRTKAEIHRLKSINGTLSATKRDLTTTIESLRRISAQRAPAGPSNFTANERDPQPHTEIRKLKEENVGLRTELSRLKIEHLSANTSAHNEIHRLRSTNGQLASQVRRLEGQLKRANGLTGTGMENSKATLTAITTQAMDVHDMADMSTQTPVELMEEPQNNGHRSPVSGNRPHSHEVFAVSRLADALLEPPPFSPTRAPLGKLPPMEAVSKKRAASLDVEEGSSKKIKVEQPSEDIARPPFNTQVVPCGSGAPGKKRAASTEVEEGNAKKTKVEQLKDGTSELSARKPQCFNCIDSGLNCNQKSPCSNCDSHNRVCIYLPCIVGNKCVNTDCCFPHDHEIQTSKQESDTNENDTNENDKSLWANWRDTTDFDSPSETQDEAQSPAPKCEDTFSA